MSFLLSWESCLALCDSNQLNLEDERGTTGNAWLRELSITHFGRNIDFPNVADVHSLHSYYPSVYQVGEPYCERSAATAGVKLLAVDGLSGVMGCHNAAWRWSGAVGIAMLYYFVVILTLLIISPQ